RRRATPRSDAASARRRCGRTTSHRTASPTDASDTTSRTWTGVWTATSTTLSKRSRSRTRPIASRALKRTASDPVSGTLRAVTIVNVLIYFGAAAYHSGVLVPAGALAPAAIAEALLGVVLVVGLVGWLSARVAYVVALAGTLFGLSIVVARAPRRRPLDPRAHARRPGRGLRASFHAPYRVIELAIRGGVVVTPDGERHAGVAISAGRITAIGEVGPASREIDARGKLVLPGCVDLHTHLA